MVAHACGWCGTAGAAGANDRAFRWLMAPQPQPTRCARRSPGAKRCRALARRGRPRGLWLVTSRASSPCRWVAATCTLPVTRAGALAKSPARPRPLSGPRGRGCAAVAAIVPAAEATPPSSGQASLAAMEAAGTVGGTEACVLVLLRAPRPAGVRCVSADLGDAVCSTEETQALR